MQKEDPPTVRHSADSAFMDAVQHGQLDVVTAMWADGLVNDIDCRNESGWTALLVAVALKHMAVAQFLLKRGASTESCTDESFTPLHVAATRDNVQMTDLLCRFGADVNAHDRYGKTALHLALALKFMDVATCLLDHDASLDVVDNEHTTVLILACLHADEPFAVRVVEQQNKTCASETTRSIVNTAGWNNATTPLIMAAERGFVKLVTALVHHGADLETRASNGASPLINATSEGHDMVVDVLLTCGADTETTQLGACTPLVIAAKKGFGRIVDRLLAHGANVNHREVNGYAALHLAAMAGHLAIVEALLKHGADPEIRQREGGTPLVAAVQNGHIEVVRCLLDHGVDIDSHSDFHATPLTISVVHGHVALTELLLERGASTACLQQGEMTGLHWAAFRGHEEIIRVLLRVGADPSALDYHGYTPAYTAMMEGHFPSAELLEEAAGASTTAYDDEIWPRQSLRELFGVSTRSEEARGRDPPWYIDCSSIRSVEPCPHLATYFAEVSIGTWGGSRVVIVEPVFVNALWQETSDTDKDTFLRGAEQQELKMKKTMFRSEVSKLYSLRHPHVIKLYGANHLGETPFLVMEHAQNRTLRLYVAENKHRTWAILLEVALGLQYLHERGIVHGRLVGGNIRIGDDGLVKLTGFGLYSQSLGDDSAFLWEAPERVMEAEQGSTFESDVYSLGMCFVEAVSGKLPYAYETSKNHNVRDRISTGKPPQKPIAFDTREWALVLQMICFRPLERVKISDVVRELIALAHHEKQEARHLVADRGTAVGTVVDDGDVNEAFETALALLNSDNRGDSEGDTDSPQRQVLRRLDDVWQQAVDTHPPPSGRLILRHLQDILARFINDLKTQASTNRAATFAAQRQDADRIFSFHNEIDRLLGKHDQLCRAVATHVHTWRERWDAHRLEQQHALEALLESVDAMDVETATCLLFELTERHDAYKSIPPPITHTARCTLSTMPGVCVPDWFIPHYEVAFDAFQSFSRGAFGSVHHGEWMGSRAVIKKVFADDDTEFEKEVAIWSQLYHPHVLQLFGACHVGQKFLVSEFASLGQLDRYLRSLKKQPAKREREVWRTLYEAALGLEYLHARGIVHCDLKCNNILVGRDGKAKVSDYGLSRMQVQESHLKPESLSPVHREDSSQHDEVTYLKPTGVGAPRWKAPEVLNGADPTVESDIYAFGMCVVEAVTGELPWGMDDRDELVSDHVRRGGALFDKPQNFSDTQWALVVDTCRFDPTERLPLASIVAQLQAFAEETMGTSNTADGAEPNEMDGVNVAEREPEPDAITETSRKDRAALSEVGDTQYAGPDATKRPTTHYEESW